MFVLRRAIRALRFVFGRPQVSKNVPRDNSAEGGTQSSSYPTPPSDILELFTLGRQLEDEVLCLCYVEFVGGPLDGHMEGVPIPIEELGVTIAIPVSPRRVAGLVGSALPRAGASRSPTSVAFYELDTNQPLPPRYHFLGAARPEDARAMWTK